ncbi:MerR family transcriptional regulator [Pseudooceanicola sp.]|uniref:MerR family transcriptional regulator n=1 Tax=Pseudooceanicola sp. TaxID=1914328 RepID=UPI00262C00F6|nr:MerR family transcriptional regulator [Pseudooceanicola sp.]MDF1854738.1 MerR family transcriptional regulator [Pseudooceanicola sp.]
MAKSADAFRTISEVSEWLETPAHVLRFWESKFVQVKPVKRAGGRRYYRPGDMELLGGIKHLLHEEGMTIKGVQKLLRERGIGHVAGLSPKAAIARDSAEPADERRDPPQAMPQAETGITAPPQPVAPPPEPPLTAPPVAESADDETDAPAPEFPPKPRRFTAPDPDTTTIVPFRHDDSTSPAAEAPEEDAAPAAPARPAPIVVDVPPDPQDADLAAGPGLLTLIARRQVPLTASAAAKATPLVEALKTWAEQQSKL